ncbi:MAG: hypothetical protein Q9219_001554 [cf. Caloplaca sp. 3 TL-2023]
MSASDSDEDLKRAIQLSLQSCRSEIKDTSTEVINLDSDDDSTTTDEAPKENSSQAKANTQSKSMPHMGMLGLDRKAMEQERLARKRKPSISPPPARKALKTSTTNVGVPASGKDSGPTPAGVVSVQPSKLDFPNGGVKKTWSLGFPRHNDIKLEEVLQKDHLKLAVLSSFQWETDWLFQKLNPANTQLVLVMQADTDDIKAQYRRETAAMKNLRLCFPSMEGQVNCMHSKLMLLSYDSHLRLVVPTANLVPYDWGETGIMENMVFLIDLPRLSAGQVHKVTQFGHELVYFLEAMGLDQVIVDSIRHFDFSATEDLAFVHTIGGAHIGPHEPWRRTGYCGLGRAISQLGLVGKEPLSIDFVTSSVGSLSFDFLLTLYLAAQGDDGLTEFEGRYQSAKKNPNHKWIKDTKENLKRQVDEGFRIYFPSRDTVRASWGGPRNGGTICFQRKWWQSESFPHGLLRDCKSRRKGLLMHNKLTSTAPVQIIYVRPTCASTLASQTSSDSKAWAYIGSANCSESAWGKLVQDRKEKRPKLNCRNWECGIVIPLRRAVTMDSQGEDKVLTGRGEITRGSGNDERRYIFEGLIPVPMEFPGEEYDGKEPWFYSD